MPNIKSAKKRVKVSSGQAARNQAQKSALKTAIKSFNSAVETEDKGTVDAAYKNAVGKLDKAVRKGILHKNNAANKKSQLTIKANSIGG